MVSVILFVPVMCECMDFLFFLKYILLVLGWQYAEAVEWNPNLALGRGLT
jgi:hypothetical protein